MKSQRARCSAPPDIQSVRSGVILPVVLVLIGLLALTMAGFVFFIRAETAGTIAIGDSQQARLAAESGFEKLVALLRKERDNSKAWFDNPTLWRNALVYSDSFDDSKDPYVGGRSRMDAFDKDEPLPPAWRFSVVSANLDPAAKTIRYGITPETSKLNLNSATDEQIRMLLTPLLGNLGLENAPDIINAILDWRDEDDDPREGGAENSYYNALTPPYNCKNGPFTTIEELLLVKGVNAAILYGEDVNQNGLLDANEDDGDASFPPYDNGDGVLNHGIAPFLTVWSREPDTAIDNKVRINLNGDANLIQAQIAEQFQNGELSDATIAFIMQVKQQGIPLRSPADLFPGTGAAPAGGPPQTGDKTGAQGDEKNSNGGRSPTGGQANNNKNANANANANSGGGAKPPSNANANANRNSNSNPRTGDGAKNGSTRNTNSGGGGTRAGSGINANRNASGGTKAGGVKKTNGRQQSQEKHDDANDPPKSGGDDDNIAAEQNGGAKNPLNTGQDDGKNGAGGEPPPEQPPTQAPAQGQDPRLLTSPVQPEEMPYIMDRFTTKTAGQEGLVGLININTAPVEVLATIPGLTPEGAAALVAGRAGLDANAIRTTAWPLTSQALDVDTWQAIAPYITTKSYQFHIEIVGYGDHTKISHRAEWIIEMLGPLPQVRYRRDLTSLGMAWPIDDDSAVSTVH